MASQTLSPRATTVGAAVVGVGIVCVLLSLWTNPVVLGRLVPPPTAHLIYFFLGAFVIFLGSRVMLLERRLRSLEETATRALGEPPAA